MARAERLKVRISSVGFGRPRLTARGYVTFRLGNARGRTAWFNFFIRPFGAPSLAGFWRRWNPVYGYFLNRCYKQLRRLMPRPLAMLLTFLACGFCLHDAPAWLALRRMLPPGGTIAFALFGAGAIVGEACRVDLSRQPAGIRAAVNVTYLSACTAMMLLIVRRVWLRPRARQTDPAVDAQSR